LNSNNLYDKNITYASACLIFRYKMVEKVVIEQRIHNKTDFSFKQVDVILAEVKEKMNVHPVSNIEEFKESFKSSINIFD